MLWTGCSRVVIDISTLTALRVMGRTTSSPRSSAPRSLFPCLGVVLHSAHGSPWCWWTSTWTIPNGRFASASCQPDLARVLILQKSERIVRLGRPQSFAPRCGATTGSWQRLTAGVVPGSCSGSHEGFPSYSVNATNPRARDPKVCFPLPSVPHPSVAPWTLTSGTKPVELEFLRTLPHLSRRLHHHSTGLRSASWAAPAT
jgi:hypothetical protein